VRIRVSLKVVWEEAFIDKIVLSLKERKFSNSKLNNITFTPFENNMSEYKHYILYFNKCQAKSELFSQFLA